MASRRVSPTDVADMIDSLEEEVRNFHDFDRRIEEKMEAKLFEVKAISYLTLLLVAILLAIVMGVVVRAIGL